MVKRGFPHNDSLYQLVAAAYDAARTLSGEVHGMAASGGSRPPRAKE